MPDIIETIKQGAGQVLSGIDQKGQIKSALEGIRRQWSEMERRRKTSSLRNVVKAIQGETKQLTEALGYQTLSLFDAGKIVHPELSRLCERIDELRSEIRQKKADLAELEVQAPARNIKCPQCQASVPADAESCPKCGARFRKRATETTAAPSAGTRTVVRLRCPRCGTILSPEAGSCPTCGVKIRRPQTRPERARFCPSCGAEMSVNARFCPICGRAT